MYYKFVPNVLSIIILMVVGFHGLAIAGTANKPIKVNKTFLDWCLYSGSSAASLTVEQVFRALFSDDELMSMNDNEKEKNCKQAYAKVLKLTKLDISPYALVGNTYNDIPDEQRYVSDLRPIQSLTNLTELNLNNQFLIKDISPLSSLTNLRKLHLAGNRIVDIKPLIPLKKLQYIDLSENNITDITPLKSLRTLQKVELSNNPISIKTCPLSRQSICKF